MAKNYNYHFAGKTFKNDKEFKKQAKIFFESLDAAGLMFISPKVKNDFAKSLAKKGWKIDFANKTLTKIKKQPAKKQPIGKQPKLNKWGF